MSVAIEKNLIAPCGMNCAVCQGHLRENNPCPGCRDDSVKKPKTRVNCKIKTCTKRQGEFCHECGEFPCENLKHLDQRYQTKYGMSQIANLEMIRDKGIEKFIELQTKKYVSEKGVFCVHDKKFYRD